MFWRTDLRELWMELDTSAPLTSMIEGNLMLKELNMVRPRTHSWDIQTAICILERRWLASHRHNHLPMFQAWITTNWEFSTRFPSTSVSLHFHIRLGEMVPCCQEQSLSPQLWNSGLWEFSAINTCITVAGICRPPGHIAMSTLPIQLFSVNCYNVVIEIQLGHGAAFAEFWLAFWIYPCFWREVERNVQLLPVMLSFPFQK